MQNADEQEFIDIRENVRNAVLNALDSVAHIYGLEHGWKDRDLPALFRELDSHASRLFDRIGDIS